MTIKDIFLKILDLNIMDLTPIGIGVLVIFSIYLMFYWEGKIRDWLRLPIINLILFILLLIGGIVEEIYLTFHPQKRTKWIKTTIFQTFF